jgi:hypothetical protein
LNNIFLLNENGTLVCPEMGEIRFGSPGNTRNLEYSPSVATVRGDPLFIMYIICHTFSDRKVWQEHHLPCRNGAEIVFLKLEFFYNLLITSQQKFPAGGLRLSQFVPFSHTPPPNFSKVNERTECPCLLFT